MYIISQYAEDLSGNIYYQLFLIIPGSDRGDGAGSIPGNCSQQPHPIRQLFITNGILSILRDRYHHHGSSAIIRRDRQESAAHDRKSLPDVFECNMGFAVINGVKTAAVIRNCDLTAVIRLSCPDQDVKRAGVRIPPMLDGIFYDGLQGQRRYTEEDMWCIVIDNQAVPILGLFYGKVSPGMLQLRRKGIGAELVIALKFLRR